MSKQLAWNNVKFYDGSTLSGLIDTAAKAVKVMECSNSRISIEEHSDIKNGICKYKYEVWNHDIMKGSLYLESEITFYELFDYLKDNNLFATKSVLKDYIFDLTNEALEVYLLHKRNAGQFYEVEAN